MYVLEFLQTNWIWLFLTFLAALILSVACLGVASLILVRLPATYFSDPHSHASWMQSHPALRWMVLILKNLCGSAIVVFGIVLAMPGVPGPGTLVALLGLMLMDFPGKRRLEWWLVQSPGIFAALNRLRLRFGREPFIPRRRIQ